jgi:hypothetical protein
MDVKFDKDSFPFNPHTSTNTSSIEFISYVDNHDLTASNGNDVMHDDNCSDNSSLANLHYSVE